MTPPSTSHDPLHKASGVTLVGSLIISGRQSASVSAHSKKKTKSTDPIFSKIFGNAFEQIASVYYQVILHTENQNLHFLLKSKKLRKTN